MSTSLSTDQSSMSDRAASDLPEEVAGVLAAAVLLLPRLLEAEAEAETGVAAADLPPLLPLFFIPVEEAEAGADREAGFLGPGVAAAAGVGVCWVNGDTIQSIRAPAPELVELELAAEMFRVKSGFPTSESLSSKSPIII